MAKPFRQVDTGLLPVHISDALLNIPLEKLVSDTDVEFPELGILMTRTPLEQLRNIAITIQKPENGEAIRHTGRAILLSLLMLRHRMDRSDLGSAVEIARMIGYLECQLDSMVLHAPNAIRGAEQMLTLAKNRARKREEHNRIREDFVRATSSKQWINGFASLTKPRFGIYSRLASKHGLKPRQIQRICSDLAPEAKRRRK